MRGVGRCGSVACGVAQRVQTGAFRFVLTFFCILDVVLMDFSCWLFVFVCLCAAVYGVIKNNNKGLFIAHEPK